MLLFSILKHASGDQSPLLSRIVTLFDSPYSETASSHVLNDKAMRFCIRKLIQNDTTGEWWLITLSVIMTRQCLKFCLFKYIEANFPGQLLTSAVILWIHYLKTIHYSYTGVDYLLDFHQNICVCEI